ncbi:MAG: hypothetical protein ABWY11_21645 [Umezawaea sp.]
MRIEFLIPFIASGLTLFVMIWLQTGKAAKRSAAFDAGEEVALETRLRKPRQSWAKGDLRLNSLGATWTSRTGDRTPLPLPGTAFVDERKPRTSSNRVVFRVSLDGEQAELAVVPQDTPLLAKAVHRPELA